MILTETVQSPVNGYLFVLERSLRTFLSSDVVRDAVREMESHISDRVASAEGSANERDAIERILLELGPPLRVAQASSAERIVDEAIAAERVGPMLRAVWRLAVSTVAGFVAALGVLVGYLIGLAFLIVAVLKPRFPDNVGFWVNDAGGPPWRLAAQFPAPANEHVVGGYWIIPISLAIGLAMLALTHRGTMAFLRWWRARASHPAIP